MKNIRLNQRPQLVESESQFRMSTQRILGFVFSVLFGCLLLYHDRRATIELEIRKREVESNVDERARVAHHFIDGIPKCFADCIFPRALKSGCALGDTECICKTLQYPNDVPSTRRIETRLKARCFDGRGHLMSEKKCSSPKKGAPVFIGGPGKLETCWSKCSVQDHVYAPRFISDYCSSLDITFELPGLQIPIGRRQVSGISEYPLQTASAVAPPKDPQATTKTSPTQKSTTTTTRGTSFPTFSVSDNNEGLSTGAKVGIGVAIPLVGLIGIGIFAFWFFHIRQKRKVRYDPTYQETYSGMPELGDGAHPPNELVGEATMTQTSDTKKSSIMRHLDIGEAVAVGKTTGTKKPEAVYHRPAPNESRGVMINEMDSLPQPPRAFELSNQPSSNSTSPMQRKPAPVISSGGIASTSGFPAPWQSTGDEGLAMPAMMANLGHTSAKSLTLQENKPTPPTQPQFITTTPRPTQSHVSGSESPSAYPTPILHPPTTGSSTSMGTPQTAFSPPTAPSGTPGTLQDQELARMEREMAAIREKKERLKQVAELEEREEALRMGIEARKSQMNMVPGGSEPS